MSVHVAAARPQQMSAGAAAFRVVTTLALFLLVFLTFLIAPLLALGLGYVVYLVVRSRGAQRPSGGASTETDATPTSATGFGTGA